MNGWTSGWTPAADNKLIELWNNGAAAEDLRAEFPGRTRNAIIGRIFRLRKKGRDLRRVEERDWKPERKATVKPPTPKEEKKERRVLLRTPVERLKPPTSPGVIIRDLDANGCRYVTGPFNTGEPYTFLFCNAPGIIKTASACYCAYHFRKMRVPTA